MTPVIVLAIDSRTPAFLSSLFIYFTPYILLRTFTVVYVTSVVVRAGLFITPECAQSHKDLAHIIDVTQVSNWC